MSDFKDKLNGLLGKIEDEILFTFITKLNDKYIRLFVTNVEAKDNGFMIDFFSDSTLSEEDESIVRKHLADYLLESINKLDAG
jgi:hypothetical protein